MGKGHPLFGTVLPSVWLVFCNSTGLSIHMDCTVGRDKCPSTVHCQQWQIFLTQQNILYNIRTPLNN
jgi:hypothetical protein